jgi:hypothetical protein
MSSYKGRLSSIGTAGVLSWVVRPAFLGFTGGARLGTAREGELGGPSLDSSEALV